MMRTALEYTQSALALAWLCCLGASQATAQTPAHAPHHDSAASDRAPSTTRAPGRPDPMDPTAPSAAWVPPRPFADYRPFQATAAGSWRDANEAVRRAGGWRAYAREAADAGAPAAPGTTSPSPKAAQPVSGGTAAGASHHPSHDGARR